MADIKITADQFAAEMKLTMAEISKLTMEAHKNAVNATSTATLRVTKEKSPVKTGKYKRGWNSRGLNGNTMNYGRVVYNGPKYMLTHLLQNGHRGPHPARAFPHIPTDDETENIYVENLRKEIAKS